MKKIISIALVVALITASIPPREVEASWFSNLMGGLFTIITAPIWVFCPDNPTFRKNNPFRKKVWELDDDKPFVQENKFQQDDYKLPPRLPVRTDFYRPDTTQEPIDTLSPQLQHLKPTVEPTLETPRPEPTARPIIRPIASSRARPRVSPRARPTARPRTRPIAQPTASPRTRPIAQPTASPIARTTAHPTAQPTVETMPEPTSWIKEQIEDIKTWHNRRAKFTFVWMSIDFILGQGKRLYKKWKKPAVAADNVHPKDPYQGKGRRFGRGVQIARKILGFVEDNTLVLGMGINGCGMVMGFIVPRGNRPHDFPFEERVEQVAPTAPEPEEERPEPLQVMGVAGSPAVVIAPPRMPAGITTVIPTHPVVIDAEEAPPAVGPFEEEEEEVDPVPPPPAVDLGHPVAAPLPGEPLIPLPAPAQPFVLGGAEPGALPVAPAPVVPALAPDPAPAPVAPPLVPLPAQELPFGYARNPIPRHLGWRIIQMPEWATTVAHNPVVTDAGEAPPAVDITGESHGVPDEDSPVEEEEEPEPEPDPEAPPVPAAIRHAVLNALHFIRTFRPAGYADLDDYDALIRNYQILLDNPAEAALHVNLAECRKKMKRAKAQRKSQASMLEKQERMAEEAKLKPPLQKEIEKIEYALAVVERNLRDRRYEAQWAELEKKRVKLEQELEDKSARLAKGETS